MSIEHVGESNLAYVVIVRKRAKPMRLFKRHLEFGIGLARGHFIRDRFDFARVLRTLAAGHPCRAIFNEAIGVTPNVVRGTLRGNRDWGLILHLFTFCESIKQ